MTLLTVADLITILQAEPNQARIILLGSDYEATPCFDPVKPKPLPCVARQSPDGSWRTGLESLTPDLIAKGFSEEDVLTDGVPALILYP